MDRISQRKEEQFRNNKAVDEEDIKSPMLKALDLMEYVNSKKENITYTSGARLKENNDRELLADKILDLLKDIDIPRAQLLKYEAYEIKGPAFKKKAIKELEDFLKNENLRLEDFKEDKNILEKKIYREIEDEEKDKLLIEAMVTYLKDQIEIKLLDAYLSEKMFEEIEDYILKYPIDEKYSYDRYIILASSYIKQKKYDKAEENYKKALKISPDSQIIHRYIAELYLKKVNDQENIHKKVQGYIYSNRWKKITK